MDGELKVQGKVLFIDPTKDVSKKENPFLVAGFALDASVVISGKRYENFLGFQCKQDNCKKLDGLNIGDEVVVSFELNGNVGKNDKVDGTERNPESKTCFTTLSAYDIQIVKRVAASTPVPHPAPETQGAETEKDHLPF